MTQRITKFGVEVFGKPLPRVTPSSEVNTVFPLFSDNNWRGEFSDETVWSTSISKSKTKLAEEREGRYTRPQLNFNVLSSGLNRKETGRLLSNAFQICSTPSAMPIYSDETAITAVAGSKLSCDTTYRRFFPGQRIAVVPQNYSLISNATQVQIGIVDYTEPDFIQLTGALGTSPSIGDRVLPLIDAETSLSQELEALTDGVAEWLQSYRQLAGKGCLPAFSEEDIHYISSYYKGYPIWDLSYNWRDSIKVAIVREGSSAEQGNMNLVTVDGESPVFSFEGTYEMYSKADVWKASRFFDSRKGMLRPFWAINPITLFDLSSIDNTTTLQVEVFSTPTHVVAMINDIAIIQADGSISLHQVDTVTPSGSKLILDINVSTPIPLTADSVTLANLCRFDQDNMKRIWQSDGVCSFDLAHRSLLNEGEFLLQ